MKWYVFATAGLPFPNPGALLIQRCLIRALGVPEDVMFFHFIKLHSFLTVVTNMILVDKNFWVVLMTLDCLKHTALKQDLLLFDTLMKIDGAFFFLFFFFGFIRSFVSICSKKKKFSWDGCASCVPVWPVCCGFRGCWVWFVKWFFPHFPFQFDPSAVRLIN